MILNRRIDLSGIHIPVIPEIYNPILDELEKMDIKELRTLISHPSLNEMSRSQIAIILRKKLNNLKEVAKKPKITENDYQTTDF